MFWRTTPKLPEIGNHQQTTAFSINSDKNWNKYLKGTIFFIASTTNRCWPFWPPTAAAKQMRRNLNRPMRPRWNSAELDRSQKHKSDLDEKNNYFDLPRGRLDFIRKEKYKQYRLNSVRRKFTQAKPKDANKSRFMETSIMATRIASSIVCFKVFIIVSRFTFFLANSIQAFSRIRIQVLYTC